MGPSATAVVKRLSTVLAGKQQKELSVVAGWVRTRISFSLLRSTLTCLRGTRGIKKPNAKESINIDLAVAEAKIARA